MADPIALTQLPIGSSFKLAGRITADTGTTMSIELLQPDGTTHGSIAVTKSSGAISGTLTVALADTLVEPVAIALAVNDVVMEQATGRTLVVRAVGLGPDGTLWSDATSGGTTYQAVGWTKVGTATLT